MLGEEVALRSSISTISIILIRQLLLPIKSYLFLTITLLSGKTVTNSQPLSK